MALERSISLVLFFGLLTVFDSTARKIPSSKTSGTDAIVGGKEVDIKDYPYQVSISLGDGNEEDNFHCGGFIISENYILTAAHCLRESPAGMIIRVGSSWHKNGTIIPIAKIVAHPNFAWITADADVGVIQTENPIEFNDFVKPIELPLIHKPLKDDSIVTVTGWGRTAVNESGTEHLMAVDIPVVNFYKCWSIYSKILTRNMWCGGDFELGGIGPCHGDSGGPAVQDGVVVGIVSWGKPCALPQSASVFVDIAAPAVRKFITKETGL